MDKLESQFTGHLALKVSSRVHDMPDEEKRAAVQEVVDIVEQFRDKVTLRGAYLVQGFRGDTDLLLWMHGKDIEDVQKLQLRIRKSAFGKVAESSHAFVGMVRHMEFNKNHIPSFSKGIPPRKYLCFYPFVRSAEWYLLPSIERRALLQEHGAMGHEFKEILTNGVHAFGLGEAEWLLSYETDDLSVFVPMIRRLRDSKSRLYAKSEGPFIIGRRVELKEAIAEVLYL